MSFCWRMVACKCKLWRKRILKNGIIVRRDVGCLYYHCHYHVAPDTGDGGTLYKDFLLTFKMI